MKKITSRLKKNILNIAVLFTACAGINAQFIPKLHVEGRILKDINGDTVMLRGASLGDITSQNYYNLGGKSAVQMLDVLTDTASGWHINMVRVPIHPDVDWTGPDGWAQISHEEFDTTQLKPFIDRATELGIYVIIDLHFIGNSTGKDHLGKYVDDRLLDFWKFIAPRYSSYDNVMYELFNEPTDDCNDWGAWVDRAQYWVDIIRSYSSNIVWVGCPCWSQQIGGSADDPITGGNIGYVSHIYPNSGVDYAISEAVKASGKAPVILGEWGWRKGTASDLSNDTQYDDKIKEMVTNNNMSFSAWSATDDWEPGVFTDDYETIDTDSHGPFLLNWLSEIKDSYISDTTINVSASVDTMFIQTHPGTSLIDEQSLVNIRYQVISVADSVSIELFNENWELVTINTDTFSSPAIGDKDLIVKHASDLSKGNYYLVASISNNGVKIISDTASVNIQPRTKVLEMKFGTGGGRYAENDTAFVKADDAPIGKEFGFWSGDTTYLDDPKSPETFLIMPNKAINLRANYVAKELPTSINDNNSSNIDIYPNPLKGEMLYINADTPINLVTIYSVTGEKLTSYQYSNKRFALSLHMNKYPSGVYFIKINKSMFKLLIEQQG